MLFVDDLISFVSKNLKKLVSREISLKDKAPQFKGLYLLDSNPLIYFLYWVVSKCTGNIEHSALRANAFLGFLGVLGTFFVGRELFDTSTGLTAALVLTFSGYHLNYSRSVHAEVSCGTFYVWGTYAYLLSLKSSQPILLILAGLMIGCAFACNSRQFYIPFFFFGYELFFWTFGQTDHISTRALLLGMSMFLPIMVIEELFVFLRALGYPYPTYFMQLFERTGQGLLLDFKFPSFKVYYKTFTAFDGHISILFLLIGTWFLSRNIGFENAIILSQCFFPILFWSMRPTYELSLRKGSLGSYQFAVPRLASSSICAFSIIIAFGITSLVQFWPFTLSFIILNGIWYSIKVVSIRSGYKSAIEFIQNQKNASYISLCHPISDFFEKSENEVIHFDKVGDESGLKELIEKNNCKYLLYIETIHKNVLKSSIFPYLDKIVHLLKPVYTVELGYRKLLPLYYEDNCINPEIIDPCNISVYDLSPMIRHI